MSKVKKLLQEARDAQNREIDLVDQNISALEECPSLSEAEQLLCPYLEKILTVGGFSLCVSVSMTFVTRLTISHNRIHELPAGLANLINLEILNVSNNNLQELPVSISSMPKLRILNVSINRLNSLPRGFGAFPMLEVLDLSYNNLNENELPGNFFMMETLRALYLGDNDFEFIPTNIGNLKNLQIVSRGV